MMREDSTFENTAWVIARAGFSEGNLTKYFQSYLKSKGVDMFSFYII